MIARHLRILAYPIQKIPTVLSNLELARPVLERPQMLEGVAHSAILCRTDPVRYWHLCWQKVFSAIKKWNIKFILFAKKVITTRQAKPYLSMNDGCGIHFLYLMSLISQTLVLVFSRNYVFQQHLSLVLTSLSEFAIWHKNRVILFNVT